MSNETASRIPTHAAIIVDGNRRWARQRMLPASFGHKAGFDRLKEITRYAVGDRGVHVLSLYVFSTENFARDAKEVGYLMDLFANNFRTIADAVELPIILYNIPGRCVVNMEAETTLRLAHDCDNVVAVKEASGKMDQVEAIVAGAPDGFVVYSGDDSATLDVMKRGGAGVISTIGNVSPARMKEIVELAAAGDWEAAEAANERLMPLMTGLFETSNPILVKEALKLLGFPVGGVRLPLVDATPEQSERLAATMREVGVL